MSKDATATGSDTTATATGTTDAVFIAPPAKTDETTTTTEDVTTVTEEDKAAETAAEATQEEAKETTTEKAEIVDEDTDDEITEDDLEGFDAKTRSLIKKLNKENQSLRNRMKSFEKADVIRSLGLDPETDSDFIIGKTREELLESAKKFQARLGITKTDEATDNNTNKTNVVKTAPTKKVEVTVPGASESREAQIQRIMETKDYAALEKLMANR